HHRRDDEPCSAGEESEDQADPGEDLRPGNDEHEVDEEVVRQIEFELADRRGEHVRSLQLDVPRIDEERAEKDAQHDLDDVLRLRAGATEAGIEDSDTRRQWARARPDDYFFSTGYPSRSHSG